MKDGITRLNAMKLYALEMLLAAAHHVDPPPSNPRRIPCRFKELDLKHVLSFDAPGATFDEGIDPAFAYLFSLTGTFRGYDETVTGEGSIQSLAGVMMGQCLIRSPRLDGDYVWRFKSVLKYDEALLSSVERHPA